MPSPLVTAIVPVYNRPWCIGRALRSVAEQTYRPLELIVVDDGSTDETPRLLEELRPELEARGIDCRILTQANRGVSAARNAAIAEARGQYLALLDSDDLWLPEKTEAQVADLQATRRLISQTGERWVRDGREVSVPRKFRKRAGDLFAESLRRCAVSPSAVAMHRRLLEAIGGFDESLPACEDYEMWLRVTCRFEVGLVPEALIVKYGGHDDQLSATVEALDKYRIRAIVKLLDSVALSPARRRMAIEELREKCRIYALGCEKRGRIEESREVLALPGQYKA